MPNLCYCPRCLTTFREVDPAACPNLSCQLEAPEDGWGKVLDRGDLIDRHYVVGKVLAVGGAGLTYLAREVDSKGVPQPPELAVKVLYSARASGAYLRRLANEAQILQELAHDNIVQCHGFVHRVGHDPYLVTLFEHGGSLGQHVQRVGPLSVRAASGILRQVLLALDTAHQRGVVHRDLKPDNVLLSQQVDADVIPHVRVADFGIAKVVGGLASHITQRGSFVGTPEYAAPEQFEQLAPTAATDIFACAGLLYFMLTAEPPVTLSTRVDIESSYDELLDQIPVVLSETAVATDDAGHLQAINDLFRRMMQVRPEHRCTANEVIAVLAVILQLPEGRGGTLEITDQGAPRREAVPAATTFAVSAPPVSDPGSAPVDPPPAPRRPPVAEPTADFPSEEEDPQTPVAAPVEATRGRGWMVLLGMALGLLLVVGAVSAVVLVGLGGVLVSGDKETVDEPAPEVRHEVIHGDARVELQGVLQRHAAAIGAACGVQGRGVVLTVSSDAEGTVQAVSIDEGWLSADGADCVEAALVGKATSGEAAVRARVALDLTGTP